MSKPRLLDLFSGVGGFSLAFGRAGFQTAAFSEVEPFPCSVLSQRFQGVPNLGDVSKIDGKELRGRISVLSGGFPCQDLSVAGRRRGLAGDRSGLFWQIVRIAGEAKIPWIVLENVPGLLSSNEGRDFALVLDSLAELGYGLSWRILDAQHFGVPQRRRRVFIVGCLGRPCSSEILFESEGVRGDIAASTETGQEIVGTLGGGSGARGGANDTDRMSFVPVDPSSTSACLTGSTRWDAETETFIPEVAPALRGNFYSDHDGDEGRLVSFAENQRAEVRLSSVHPQLTTGGGKPGQGYPAVAVQTANSNMQGLITREETAWTVEPHPSQSRHAIQRGMAVRRLTPLECERLQGFPDGWTDIPGASDSARYRAMGNAVAVPVVEWIAYRLRTLIGRESPGR